MSDPSSLAQADCVPRSGPEHRLDDARVRDLMGQLPGWELAEQGQALVRTFRFEDYYRTMAFVNAPCRFAPRRCSYKKAGQPPPPVGAPAPGAKGAARMPADKTSSSKVSTLMLEPHREN